MDLIFAIFVIYTIFCYICGTYMVVKLLKRIFSLKNEDNKTSSLTGDLKTLYDNATFSDVKLETPRKTFRAHKAILSARSDVFKNMFSRNMKEKNSGHVIITDLDDETVHQLLTFIYTDSLGDLTKESAFKVYKAAHKYHIPHLKQTCSSFLIDNLRPDAVCDVILLAYKHQDINLKIHLQSYILRHDKEVFSTPKWKQFMVNNPQLAAEVMYQTVSQSRI